MTSKRNILVVDDEQTMRDFLATSLRGRFNVFTANEGAAAMTVLREHKIDLVLSDVQMPGRDGLELLSDIRKIGRAHV